MNIITWLTRPFFALARWYERRKGNVPYKSNHYTKVTLTVVYMDRDKIHDYVVSVLNSRGWKGTPKHRIYGWYDYSNNVLYCEMYDFYTAGHELMHATHKSFHDPWTK